MTRFSVVVIIAAVFGVYANSLGNGFVWDDPIYLRDNPLMSDPANIRFLLDPRYYLGTHAVLAGSRPVFLASLLVDRALWGWNAAGFHFTNVALHAANALWVHALAGLLVPAPGAALAAGLLFALHPAQTEAVNAVSFRSDLLASFFILAGLWLYLQARAGRRTGAALAGFAACLGLGLLAKESAACLPALAAASEAYFPRPEGRRVRVAIAAAAVLAVGAAFTAFWAARFEYAGLPSAKGAAVAAGAAQPGSLPLAAPQPWKAFDPSPAPWDALYSDSSAWLASLGLNHAAYAGLLAWPATLTVDRAPLIARGWGSAAALGSWLLLAAVFLFAVAARRAAPTPAFGAAWWLLALIPVAGIIPLHNPVAERYLYPATAGAALWAASLLPARRAASAAALALLAACAARTWSRNADWHDDKSLFFSPAAGEGQGPLARLTRGSILRREGRPAEALAEYEAALRLSPRYAEALAGSAMAHAALGDAAKAEAAFEGAVAAAPRNPVWRYGYGVFLAGAGRSDHAVTQYRSALELAPDYVPAWVNLGAAYRNLGRYAEAKSAYQKAILLAPGEAMPLYSYGTSLEKSGKRAEAAKLYREALARDPDFSPARAALERLGAKR